MIVLGGRRGCGCGGCLTIVIVMFVVFAFMQMRSVPGPGPQPPIHPVYPVTATPSGGGGFSAGPLTVAHHHSSDWQGNPPT